MLAAVLLGALAAASTAHPPRRRASQHGSEGRLEFQIAAGTGRSAALAAATPDGDDDGAAAGVGGGGGGGSAAAPLAATAAGRKQAEVALSAARQALVNERHRASRIRSELQVVGSRESLEELESSRLMRSVNAPEIHAHGHEPHDHGLGQSGGPIPTKRESEAHARRKLLEDVSAHGGVGTWLWNSLALRFDGVAESPLVTGLILAVESPMIRILVWFICMILVGAFCCPTVQAASGRC